MKIAMVDPSLFTGRYDDSLCSALAQCGAAVTLLGRPMRFTDALTPLDYRYVPRFFRHSEALRERLGEGRAFRLAKAAEYGLACAMGSLDSLTRQDVVHFQWLPLAPADKMLLKRLHGKVALVHTVHNADAYHADAGIQGRGYRALLDRFAALIVHGDGTRAALVAQGIDPARIYTTPHPPMRLASAGPQDLASIPPARAPRILFFGTIRPYKGVDLLVDACITLWQAGHAFELVLAGKPFMDVTPLRQRITAEGFGKRLFTDFGFLPEPRLDAHMAHADILVFPYRHIDSSGAFLSALHHGKPIVASDVGMFAHLPDGVASRFPAGNAPALAQALLPLIESEPIRQERGARVRIYGENMANWTDMARATMTIYEEVLRP